MVLRHRKNNMASEQPVKKKLRITDESESTDETDFIQSFAENGMRTDLSALHLSLPATVNEDDITLNTVNSQLNGEKLLYQRTNSEVSENNDLPTTSSSFVCSLPFIDNISMQPAPDINTTSNYIVSPLSSSQINTATNHDRNLCNDQMLVDEETLDFQSYLVKQCLCNVSETILQQSFEGYQTTDNGIRSAMLTEWSTTKILQFLSNLQLLFDVYLKQNNNGHICSRIVYICDSLIHNEYNLIEQMISLSETRNKYINYMTARVLSSFLIVAKTNINTEWLESIVNFLTTENIDYINFALEIIKRVVEWKDIEIHVLEETQVQDAPGCSNSNHDINIDCVSIPFTDPDSFDTSAIKGLIIKSLETKWPELINKIKDLILDNNSIQSQTCIITFLALWESTIAVKANLSVIDTKPFNAHLKIFVSMLNNNLPPIIWKQLLSLFNEVLCYGSTLALQDMLPEDTCGLAHLIVRFVKDHRLLSKLPYRRNEGLTVNSFIGTISCTQPSQSNVDKTLLQKMTLLVLKSVAITIKETRSDSSDSSVGSDDYDSSQDMQIIASSIGNVLKKLDFFIKASLDFHPETPFSKILIHLFSDQDDYMIESMVCTLDITIGICYHNLSLPDFVPMLNPVHSFIEFLKVVSYDSDVLLDYLVSNETCFLLYLLRFLKYIKKNWDKFMDGCCEGGVTRTNELDNTMTVLIRLKMQINRLVSKNLFPYNISPVLKLLNYCENLYEGSGYS